VELGGEGLDEVLIDLYGKLLASPGRNEGTRGRTRELLGVALRITKPRARLSRSENRGKPFSALGELLWYLSGSDKLEFILPYIRRYADDASPDGTLNGAYGPRLFAMRGVDQIEAVTTLLQRKPGTRRAVVQLYNAEDLRTDEEIPCTTTLQFHLRNERLHLSATLRSNDAYWGLPHDVFCFTMLQEMMARRLDVGLGEYLQYVGSMHIYEDFVDSAERYIAEGHHRAAEMPEMPRGDPFGLVENLLGLEHRIRQGEQIDAGAAMQEPYWADIVRLLQVFFASDDNARLDELSTCFSDPIYRSYLEERRGIRPPALSEGTKLAET
jgi:thymidylate synthase